MSQDFDAKFYTILLKICKRFDLSIKPSSV